MNLQWKNFLETHGAVFNENSDTCFTDGTNNAECQKFDLSFLGVIRISGEDRESFLQGQLTSDTRNISAQLSQLSSYCTPKGRMIASMRIIEHKQDWFMVLPASRLPVVLKRLQMFVMRSKVTLTDASEDFVCLGAKGSCLDTLSSSLPAEVHGTETIDGLSIIKVDNSENRYMLLVNINEAPSLWDSIDAAASDTSVWRLLDIEAGIPTVFEETADAFIPQMTNLQVLDAVSFTKGCYTGQEVVARMQYLGKLKRRMLPVSFTSDKDYPRGSELFSKASSSGQGAGKLVDVVKTGENTYKALAVVELASLENGDLQIENESGPIVKAEKLPYEFEPADS